MSVLRIFNVSDYVHAGAAPRKENSFSKPPSYYSGVRELPDGSYAASRLPTGGIAFALNPVFERIASDSYKDETLVFCIDDAPIIKREMYAKVLKDETGYKATRSKKSLEVSIQRKAIKDVLSLFSHNVLFAEGYEADDIIASLVWKYKSSFDHIYIHNVDEDLFCLVDDNVSIEPVGNRGKVITKDNFSLMVSDHYGYKLPFNGIFMKKLLHGDSSDNIPGVGDCFTSALENFITPEKYKFLVNPSLFRAWVGMATNYHPRVMGIADLIIPLTVPEEYLTLYDEPIDINKLCYIGNRVGNKYCKKNTWNEELSDVKEILDYYTDEYYMKGGRLNG